jgi:hypothetical protein
MDMEVAAHLPACVRAGTGWVRLGVWPPVPEGGVPLPILVHSL